jgi:hypothetical protein
MSILARLLGRLGYVKLSDYGLTLAEGGRVVYAYPRPQPVSVPLPFSMPEASPIAAPATRPFNVPVPPGYVANATRPGSAPIAPRRIHKTQMFWRAEKPLRPPAASPAPTSERTQILDVKDLMDCAGTEFDD